MLAEPPGRTDQPRSRILRELSPSRAAGERGGAPEHSEEAFAGPGKSPPSEEVASVTAGRVWPARVTVQTGIQVVPRNSPGRGRALGRGVS